ncbi:MAG: ImmA/IrrE family metallo-endopeptidase [Roseobacter sp.]
MAVFEIAKENGVEVVFANFSSNAENVAVLCGFANARIYVNEDKTSDRRSLTIAHELGHWILHRRFFVDHPDHYPVLPPFNELNRSDPLKTEANKFVACLQVPMRLLRAIKNAPVSDLPSVFGLYRSMMEFNYCSDAFLQNNLLYRVGVETWMLLAG